MSSTLITLYAAGVLVAIAGILEFEGRFRPKEPVRWRRLYIVGAALVWPIMLIGLIQIWGIAAYAKRVRRISSHPHPGQHADSAAHASSQHDSLSSRMPESI